MRTDTARTVSTVAIWFAVAAALGTVLARPFNGPPDMIVGVFVGMTASLSVGAAVGTLAVWRSPRSADSPKEFQREV